jgi:hypothetical protein
VSGSDKQFGGSENPEMGLVGWEGFAGMRAKAIGIAQSVEDMLSCDGPVLTGRAHPRKIDEPNGSLAPPDADGVVSHIVHLCRGILLVTGMRKRFTRLSHEVE